MKIVLATRNPGKIRELSRLLNIPGIAFFSLLDHPGLVLPPEDKSTYAENAVVKADAVCAHTGLPAIADDSGLEVDVLGGRPGIHSARYGGEGLTDTERVQKVLREMRSIEWKMRGARFCCALALVLPDGRKEIVRGECRGLITFRPWGQGGFGYDPVFYLPEANKTTAELSPEEKDKVSHRGHAAQKLRPFLETLVKK